MEQDKIINDMLHVAKSMLNVDVNYEELKQLTLLADIKMYNKGDIILGMGESPECTGYVLKGVIRSYYLDEQGNDNTRNFHVEHSLVMDEGLVGYDVSICAYEALEDCMVMLFPAEELRNKIMDSENLKDLYLASLESGIRYKIQRENAFLTYNATDRYLMFKKEYPNLSDRVKQSYIATYLGITPESLSRIRRTLREE